MCCRGRTRDDGINSLIGKYTSSRADTDVSITLHGLNVSIVNPPYNKTMAVTDFMVATCLAARHAVMYV